MSSGREHDTDHVCPALSLRFKHCGDTAYLVDPKDLQHPSLRADPRVQVHRNLPGVPEGRQAGPAQVFLGRLAFSWPHSSNRGEASRPWAGLHCTRGADWTFFPHIFWGMREREMVGGVCGVNVDEDKMIKWALNSSYEKNWGHHGCCCILPLSVFLLLGTSPARILFILLVSPLPIISQLYSSLRRFIWGVEVSALCGTHRGSINFLYGRPRNLFSPKTILTNLRRGRIPFSSLDRKQRYGMNA